MHNRDRNALVVAEQLAINAAVAGSRAAARHPLLVIETHPVQYHAPVYRELESTLGIPVSAIYASDFSVAGYRDREFDASFRWDTDLLSGYQSSFLSTVAQGGAGTADRASARGLHAALRAAQPAAILLTGYSPSFYRQAWITAWRQRCPLILRAETTDHARERGPAPIVAHRGAQGALPLFARLLYVGRRLPRSFPPPGRSRREAFFLPLLCGHRGFRNAAKKPARGCASHARTTRRLRQRAVLIRFRGKLTRAKVPISCCAPPNGFRPKSVTV